MLIPSALGHSETMPAKRVLPAMAVVLGIVGAAALLGLLSGPDRSSVAPVELRTDTRA